MHRGPADRQRTIAAIAQAIARFVPQATAEFAFDAELVLLFATSDKISGYVRTLIQRAQS